MTLPDGTVALITQEVPNPRPCAFCGRLTDVLCDFPLRGKKKGRTCSKRSCERCSSKIGDDLDLCPIHTKLIADHGLGARLSPLLGDDNPEGHAVALDMIEQVIGFDTTPVAFTPRSHTLTAEHHPGFPAGWANPRVIPAIQDWNEFFNERAAIFEYEGGLSRADAERNAMALAGPMPKARDAGPGSFGGRTSKSHF